MDVTHQQLVHILQTSSSLQATLWSGTCAHDCKLGTSQSRDCGVIRKASRLQSLPEQETSVLIHKHVPLVVFNIVRHHGHGCLCSVDPWRPFPHLPIHLPFLLVRVLVHLPFLLVRAIKCGANCSSNSARPAATFLGRDCLDLWQWTAKLWRNDESPMDWGHFRLPSQSESVSMRTSWIWTAAQLQ